MGRRHSNFYNIFVRHKSVRKLSLPTYSWCGLLGVLYCRKFRLWRESGDHVRLELIGRTHNQSNDIHYLWVERCLSIAHPDWHSWCPEGGQCLLWRQDLLNQLDQSLTWLQQFFHARFCDKNFDSGKGIVDLWWWRNLHDWSACIVAGSPNHNSFIDVHSYRTLPKKPCSDLHYSVYSDHWLATGLDRTHIYSIVAQPFLKLFLSHMDSRGRFR